MTISTTGDALVEVLSRLGVNVTTVGDSEIGGHCPVHVYTTGREDGSPSWSMNSNTGLWICYSCGARGNLPHLVSTLTGSSDDITEVNQFIIETGLDSLREGNTPEDSPPPKPDVDAFRRFTEVPEQLLHHRGIDQTTAYRHGIRWDPKPRHWIIPIMSPRGELRGWQAKGKGYFRNVPTGVSKSQTLFGLHLFRAQTAILLESPLDVVRLASVRLGMGVQGLSTFGASVSKEQMSLVSRWADTIVIALDNDEAGIRAAERVAQACPRPRNGITFLRYEHTNAKDIGDMTNDEIEGAITGSSPIPWWL